MAGMLLFALASLVGGLAEDRLTLVIARAIQGLGGAVVAPATLSILATTFTDRTERNKALGLWGAMGGVGGATGGLLGGALTQTLNWRWVLFINLPIGLIATFAAWRVVAEGRAERPARHFDVAGAVSVTAGLVVLTYGIVRTEVHGWASATTLTTLAVGLVLLAAFLFIEARLATEPLMPLRIFRSLPLSAANLVVFALGSSVFAMWYFVTLYLQNVLAPSLLCAAGIGFSFVPVTIAATTGVDDSESGLASGLVNTSRQVGGSLGLAVLATLATARTADVAQGMSAAEAATAGFDRAFSVGALFALAGAVAALLAANTLHRRRQRGQPAPAAAA